MTHDADELISRVSLAHGRLLHWADDLSEEQLREPSLLPGWTRAHVLAHVADNAQAFERQARYALHGDLVDMYDGGQDARTRSIEDGATRDAEALRRQLREAQQRLEATWSTFTAADWARPVRFRNATVLDTVLARWREAEIHAVDLDLGYRPRDWPAAFALHTLDFLAARVPDGVRLTLRAPDIDVPRVIGTGTAIEVTGAVRDIAAWMAGREPDGELHSTAGELPTLGPWPPDPAD